jgi:hypothetical protein
MICPNALTVTRRQQGVRFSFRGAADPDPDPLQQNRASAARRKGRGQFSTVSDHLPEMRP